MVRGADLATTPWAGHRPVTPGRAVHFPNVPATLSFLNIGARWKHTGEDRLM